MSKSYVYLILHHFDSWIKIDQLDVTCFIISLFTAQHVSNVNISIFRSLRIIVDLLQPNHTVTPTHIEPEQYNTWNKSTIIRKLLKMDILTFETCWVVNSEIIKQVTSSWSIFIHRCQNVCNCEVLNVSGSWDMTTCSIADGAASFSEKSCIYPNDGGSMLFLNVCSLHNSSKLT